MHAYLFYAIYLAYIIILCIVRGILFLVYILSLSVEFYFILMV